MAKILVVEDEIALRETLVEELTDEGHLAIEAGNGREGLERLTVDSPDMIISDITMPEMNGYQFLRSVKEKHPEHEFTPFIFLSALSDRSDQLKGLRLGVDDYLTKPVDFDLLMAKVELNLRRQIVQSKRAKSVPAPAGETAPKAAEQENLTAIEKLAAIINQNQGRLLVGRIETLGIEDLEAARAGESAEIAAQIQQLAIGVLREQLGLENAVHMLPPNALLIAFADQDQDKADSKLRELRDAIWEASFSQWNDEAIAAATTQSAVLTIDPQRPIEDEAIFAEIDERLRREKDAAGAADRATLLDNHRSKRLFALKLLTPASAPSKIKMLNFEKSVLMQNRKLLNERRYERDFLLDLYASLFKRLAEKKAFRQAFANGAMLLPIRFDLVDEADARDRMIELCKDLKERLGTTIIIELIDTPDRFHAHLDALKPLPIGGQVHFVELRRLEQLGSLELGQLKDMGVAFFTMRMKHVVQQDPAVLRHLIQTLHDSGVKFCIKEIPDGRLAEAQQFGAHLYSMH
ncbi:MAG: response regulator [Alphaproteobacteria bacterium]